MVLYCNTYGYQKGQRKWNYTTDIGEKTKTNYC